jgi:hypothetical protein
MKWLFTKEGKQKLMELCDKDEGGDGVFISWDANKKSVVLYSEDAAKRDEVKLSLDSYVNHLAETPENEMFLCKRDVRKVKTALRDLRGLEGVLRVELRGSVLVAKTYDAGKTAIQDFLKRKPLSVKIYSEVQTTAAAHALDAKLCCAMCADDEDPVMEVSCGHLYCGAKGYDCLRQDIAMAPEGNGSRPTIPFPCRGCEASNPGAAAMAIADIEKHTTDEVCEDLQKVSWNLYLQQNGLRLRNCFTVGCSNVFLLRPEAMLCRQYEGGGKKICVRCSAAEDRHVAYHGECDLHSMPGEEENNPIDKCVVSSCGCPALVNCDACKEKYCMRCSLSETSRMPSHIFNGLGLCIPDQRTQVDVVDKDSRKCPCCGVLVHKHSGCYHITCTCGGHWCWGCAKKFDYPKNPSNPDNYVYTHIDFCDRPLDNGAAANVWGR